MKTLILLTCMAFINLADKPDYSGANFEEDIINTSKGNLKITCVGHGTLMFTFNNLVIHIDPYSEQADYSKMPKADIIFITHEHGDHLDVKAINQIKKEGTKIIMNQKSKEISGIAEAFIMKNGDKKDISGIHIKAVPAYNIEHRRHDGNFYHPKGIGNGYVFTFGDKKVYVAGDTENIPEIKDLKNIDVAFLPMNIPYTMTPEMTADAAKSFKPGILYPYHYGSTDTDRLVELLKDEKDIEIRIRKF